MTIRITKVLNDVCVMLKEICNLVKKSPLRECKIRELPEKTKIQNKGIRVFCPTCCTIHGETCASVFSNHEELMELVLLVIQRWKLELWKQKISWECLGSCLAVSLDIGYYNRQTSYQKHCKKKVLQLAKLHRSFSCIHWANHR